jgi:hypothetical protein
VSRILLALAAVLTCVAGTAGPAAAQAPGPRTVQLPPGPTVSPFLNLTRRGTLPAINYYGMVRPQLNTYAGLQVLQQGILQSQLVGPAVADVDGVPTTGRPAGFMTHAPYFMTAGGPTAARGRITINAPAPARYSRSAFR